MYGQPVAARVIRARPGLGRAAGHAVLAWESLFLLPLTAPRAVVLAMLAVGVSFHAGGSARVPRRHPNVHQDQRERLTQNGAQRSASRVGLDNVHVHVHVHVQRGWHRTDRDPLILVIVDHQDGRRLPRLA
jgi:hypothetical protein